MTEEKDIALVADYLEDRLAAEEKAEVEQRLQKDDAFKALFEEIKLLQTGIGAMSHRHLLAKMDELEAEMANPLEKNEKTKTIFWTFQRIAAAFIGLALVAFASWYGINGAGGVDGPALFQEYYQAYENVMVPITRGENDQTLMEQAFQAYELKDYEKANGLFDSLLETEQASFVSLYAGITAMEIGDNEKTESLLNKIKGIDGVFAERAQWYLALHHLRLEEYNTTIILLEVLEKSESSFGTRATELLKEIR